MKINELLMIPGLAPKDSRPRGVKGAFEQCLTEAMGGQKQSPALQGAAKVASALPLAGVARVAPGPVEMLETALSRLDAFKEGLSRPDQSLKKLAPLVQDLEADSRRLAALAQNLPDHAPERPLLQETAALSWVEAFKFNRGDYL
jgi:hypothetical protein